MKSLNVIVKVPGKLMIAGEYAVLSTGYPAIVLAVNRYIHININQSSIFNFSYQESELVEVTWSFDHKGALIGLEGEEHSFIKEAISIACQLLKETMVRIVPFRLQIDNGLNDYLTGKKYGLGSSAAIVVGVISAILAFHGQSMEHEQLKLYKLSCIAHLKSQGNGSGADIAASVYGGWICYYRYDVAWLNHKLYDQNTSIGSLIHIPWPNLCIQKLVLPENIKFMAGWTKHAAKTSPLVDQIEAFQRERPKQYGVFLEESKAAVEEFIKSCELRQEAGIFHAIQKNRTTLQYLSDISGAQLETKEIRSLCHIADQYGRSKFSGAGGGDCGIAFLMKGDEMKALKQEWEQAGIMPLDLQSSEYGVVRVV
jgi:phosphomevalonate kinase